MCNNTTRSLIGDHNCISHLDRALVKHGTKRPNYVVLLNNQPCCHGHKGFRTPSVLRTSDMKRLPKRERVKENKVPSGCAMCSGEFECDCPFLFVSGGDGKHSKEIWFYDILRYRWTKLGKMKKPHSGHSMHCVNKRLYVVGGKSDGLIEMYDPVEMNKKDKIVKGRDMAVRACLKVKVHDFPSAVYNGKIYVFGGISDNGPVKCVQYFDTRLVGSFGQLPENLPCECHGGAATVVNNAIYVATQQGQLVRFDPATGKSCFCTNQPFRRRNFSLVENDNKLCIFGGETCESQGPESLPVCTYDPETDAWAEGRERHSCVVTASCVVEYSKSSLFTPFRQDPLSHVPHTCKMDKL